MSAISTCMSKSTPTKKTKWSLRNFVLVLAIVLAAVMIVAAQAQAR